MSDTRKKAYEKLNAFLKQSLWPLAYGDYLKSLNALYASEFSDQAFQSITEKTLADVQAGIPARDAEIEALRKEIEILRGTQGKTDQRIKVCQGKNCNATAGQEHSNECIVEAAESQGWAYSPEAEAARLAMAKPDFFTFVINGTHRDISETEPPHDSYDEGSLIPLYKAQQPVSGADGLPSNTDFDGWAEDLSRLGYECNREGVEAYLRKIFSDRAALDHLPDATKMVAADQFRDAAQMIEPSGNSGELDERKVFESWVQKRDGFPYARQFMNLMWESWQARAAIEAARKEPGQ